jgi:hypothetical protein
MLTPEQASNMMRVNPDHVIACTTEPAGFTAGTRVTFSAYLDSGAVITRVIDTSVVESLIDYLMPGPLRNVG